MKLVSPIVRPPGEFYEPLQSIDIAASIYMLSLSDAGKVLRFFSACTVTIPSFVFNEGSPPILLISNTSESVEVRGQSSLALNVLSGLNPSIDDLNHIAKITFINETQAIFSCLNQEPSLPTDPSSILIEDNASGPSGSVDGREPGTVSNGNTWRIPPLIGPLDRALDINGAGKFARNSGPQSSNAIGIIDYSGTSSIRITAEIRELPANSGTASGVVFDFIDSNNFSWLQAAGNGAFKVRQFVNGNGVNILEATHSESGNNPIIISVELSASGLFAYVGSELLISDLNDYSGIAKTVGILIRDSRHQIDRWVLESI